MRLGRLVLAQAMSWSAIVFAAAAGLAAVLTAVDGGGSLEPAVALAVGALRVPGLLVFLLPLLCGLAAGLASARLLARGERLVLELAGVAPSSVAGLGCVAAVGLASLGWMVHDRVVPGAESLADALGGHDEAPWVFLDGEAVRVDDGTVVEVEEHAIVAVSQLAADRLDGSRLQAAAAAQRPARAPVAVLRSAGTRPARTELSARAARIPVAALLAFLGWLPLSRAPATQVALTLGAGLTWAGVDVALRAASAQGRVPAALGAWGAALLALGLVLGALVWCRRTRAPGGGTGLSGP